jgi:wyosine [tRNA(Phe)-imidazoG37] synthetase (radical SAM superfamily)
LSKLLDVLDHSRHSAGLTYVYPVVSRRSGGVSVGINLNPDNACNWRCIYCQVPNLRRGAAPWIDTPKLVAELRGFLHELLHGDFMEQQVPASMRRLVDIAFSGNGEPTSAKGFDGIVGLVGEVMAEFGLVGRIRLVLITNGSLTHRGEVQEGLRRMAELGGEVWFKLDSATPQGMRRINNAPQSPQRVRGHLRTAADLCPTWLQTCIFALDGAPPSPEERAAYLDFVGEVVGEGVPLQGVMLYGLARPSLQSEAPRLSRLPEEWGRAFAAEIESLGLPVKLSI